MKKNKIIFIILSLIILNIFLYRVFNFELEKYKINSYFNKNNIYEKKINLDNEYVGVLEINKIKLKKGFYEIDSKYNTVNNGIEVLKYSKMPDQEGNIFFASHSGLSKISYFNKLDELEKSDKINIYYKNVIYVYEIYDIYEVKKGSLFIDNDILNNIYLITCSKKNNNQLIYVGKKVNSI